MGNFNCIVMIFLLYLQIFLSTSCTAGEISIKSSNIIASPGHYTVYIINNSIHTGIVIPVDRESLHMISALKYFNNFQFTDIGWGEETAYQDTEDIYWHYVKAVLYPNPSVICIEGYRSLPDSFIGWSDFTVMLSLSSEQFIKLTAFIENSFKKDQGNEVIITSKRHLDQMIFFKSVKRYHLFNTCNTWVAAALQSSGFDVSPSLVITAGQLFNEIKKQGTVLKSLK